MILITNTAPETRDVPPGSIPNALTMNGSHLEVINMLLSNGGQGIQCSATAVDHLVYGCLIFHNGYVGGYGHGVYIQNISSEGKRYLQNIVFDNFEANFAPHGSLGQVDHIEFSDGVLFNAGSPVGEPGNNLFWDNSVPIQCPIFSRNAVYQGQANPVQNRLGDPDNPTTAIEVVDNYIVNAPGALVIYGSQIEITRLDGNEFYGSVAGWDTAAFPNNVYSVTVPTSGHKIHLKKNAYAERAHLTVFNFDEDDTVQVDIPALGWTGQVIARNVQSYFDDFQTLEIVDGIITINMDAKNRTVAAPVAWTAPATTFPKFGAFILEHA